MPTLMRTIHFFRTYVTDPGGRAVADQGIMWKRLSALPYLNADPCRGRLINGDRVSGKARVLSTGRVEGEFGTCRLVDLPLKQDATEAREDLPLLQDEGL